MTTIHLEAKDIPAALRGGYSGQKFKAMVREEMTIPMDAGLWSGGSRDTYRLVRLADGREIEPVNHNAAPWDKRADLPVTLQPGFVVVRHSMFCGKDMGLTFYVHPQDAAQMLPAPVELTEHEAIVIDATCGLKSSYGGKDRYQLKCERYGEPNLMTRAEWDAAKASLIARGYLNKAGAITVAGRNARPSRY